MSSRIVESQPASLGVQAAATQTADNFKLPFPIRKFSVAEYELLGRYGILCEDDNVELLEGYISEKVPKTPQHVYVMAKVFMAIHDRLPANYYLRNQAPILLTDSLPEPDLAIVTGSHHDFSERHPGPSDVVLLIEVADASVARDRHKARICGRGGLRCYWIVNLIERCVEIYSDPISTEPARYRSTVVLSINDTAQITLSENQSLSIPVAEFLLGR